jgi:branched-chain amino acid transport system substrate-binding protein
MYKNDEANLGRAPIPLLRRHLLAAPLATPALAQEVRPIRIGVTADMSGTFVDTTGPGQTVATQLAVEDFGGTLLGRPIQVLQSDDQNRPDIGNTTARRWYDAEGVDVIIGGGNSAVANAILQVARERARAFLIVGAGNPDFSGRMCSPISTHWAYDTFAQAASTGDYPSRAAGGGGWFFITADYAFGHALERDTTRVVQAAGGRVLGSVRVPLGTTDYSSFLLQAQAARPAIVGLATAGQDLVNAVKQAAEFGLARPGSNIRVAGLSLLANDVPGIGLAAAQGLIASESFYWDMNDGTRDFTRRFQARRPRMPNMLHAGCYSAAMHWMRAVAAEGSLDGAAVTRRMKATPVNDFNNRDIAIRPDGRVLHTMHILRAKTPAASRDRLDAMEVIATLPGERVFRPAAEGGCTLGA